jgi:hypothetical protein
MILSKGMLVPKSMINLKDIFGGILEKPQERPKSNRVFKGSKSTQRIVPYNKKFNPDAYLSSA